MGLEQGPHPMPTHRGPQSSTAWAPWFEHTPFLLQWLLGCECGKNATPETSGEVRAHSALSRPPCRAELLGPTVALPLAGALPHP